MASLEDDEESNAGSSDNDVDKTMEDLGDAEADQTQDMDADMYNEDDNEYNEEDEDQDETQDNYDDSPLRARTQHFSQQFAKDSKQADPSREGESEDSRVRPTSTTNGEALNSAHTPRGTTPIDPSYSPYRPALREGAVKALIYDIAPTIAAPHSTSINTVTATPDMRWVFSGGSDGWVRKFNWVDTANGKSMLTVAQRHPFVESVVKAGVLMSYWENEDTTEKTSSSQPNEEIPLSPVYSLAVQHQALWLLSGTESGAINLQSVRHKEGERITSLYQHTSAVSVMSLSQDESSLLSGSWDKTIADWDLNTGQVKRSFTGSGGQIAAIEIRPFSSLPVPKEMPQPSTNTNGTMFSDSAERRARGSRGSLSSARDANRRPEMPEGTGSPGGDSLFGDNDSLFGDNDTSAGPTVGFGQDDDDEFSKAIANGVSDANQLDGDGDVDMNFESSSAAMDAPVEAEQNDDSTMAIFDVEPATTEGNNDLTTNGLPHSEDVVGGNGENEKDNTEPDSFSENTFLDAAIDGTFRIWDRRQPSSIARVVPHRNTPPWCTHACWSPDGNFIYVGRRNNTVDEYSLHKSLREPIRTLKFPHGSGPVSAVRAMPNGRHLICASHDILRLYDLKHEENTKHSTVPFLIVPGHRTGVVSQLYMDPTCTFLISTGGNRGWEGMSTEVLLGYEIGLQV